MPTPSASDIRRQFIEFFRTKPAAGDGHSFVPSSPVVPHEDPTLLFANAGMNQFKPLFLGQADPAGPLAGLKRAVNSQKCIRAGGKHNDLEDVGKDTYHHTFFEMLGNWSFGDYFKAEAIDWAWELLTGVYGIDPDRLYATYFGGGEKTGLEPDEEAKELWLRHLPPERVLPGSFKDNFWEMGETGPCGPCSEVHIDRVGGRDAAALVNADDPEVIELWNLVFIQFNREGPDSLKPLPARHVDTGMGLERLASVLQSGPGQRKTNYDTDLFTPIFGALREMTGAEPYLGRVGDEDERRVDTAYRVVADHVRALTFAITDGCVPGNDGRGYVLRRILRRGVRFGRQMLGAETGFMSRLVPVVVEIMGEAFPELHKNPGRVQEIVREEEESFGRTLDRGIDIFRRHAIGACIRRLHQEQREMPEKTRIEARPRGFTFITEEESAALDRGELPDRLLPLSTRDDVVIERRGDPSEPIDEFPADFGAVARLRHYLAGTPTIAGEEVFVLYDTYGFPLDLTELMAEEHGLAVDIQGFSRCMEQQRERSRAGAKGTEAHALELSADAIARLKYLQTPPTDDSHKYPGRDVRATVKAIWNGHDFDTHAGAANSTRRPIGIVLDRTCFYAEAGGQVADTGRLHVMETAEYGVDTPRGKGDFRVEAVRAFGGYVLHIGHMTSGTIRTGDRVNVHIDQDRRAHIRANHTATHLLNLALRQTLGPETDQKGSLVAPDRLRFDFPHNGPVPDEALAHVESIVREKVAQDLEVFADSAPLEQARRVNGLRAVFGETYPDPVRVVSIGRPVADLLADPENEKWAGLSVEFCGGTHLPRTSEAGPFALLTETGIAKGIRRVEAVTGTPAQAAIDAGDRLAAQIAEASKLPDEQLPSEIAQINAEIDGLALSAARRAELRTQLGGLQERAKAAQKRAAAGAAKRAQEESRKLGERARAEGQTVVVGTVEAGSDRKALQAALGTVRDMCPDAAVMLISPDEEEARVAIVAGVPKGLIQRGLKAGDWVRVAAEACGGKGGGKPDSAQGGGTDPSKAGEAASQAEAWARRTLGD